MKLKNGNDIINVTWNSHSCNCDKCRRVDLDKSATFASACVLGSKLVMEELVARQRPAQTEKTKAIETWAKNAGVFKVGRPLPFTTKYVEDDAA